MLCWARQVVAKFVGTVYLVATIISSGMRGDNLYPDDGIALLGNTVATGGMLFVLIGMLGELWLAQRPLFHLRSCLWSALQSPCVDRLLPGT